MLTILTLLEEFVVGHEPGRLVHGTCFISYDLLYINIYLQDLLRKWEFTCSCQVCSSSPEELKKNDDIRK